MDHGCDERLLRQIIEQLDTAERLLLHPQPNELDRLMTALSVCWSTLSELQLSASAGTAPPAVKQQLLEILQRANHLDLLVQHAAMLVDGCLQSHAGGYSAQGRWAVPVAPVAAAVNESA